MDLSGNSMRGPVARLAALDPGDVEERGAAAVAEPFAERIGFPVSLEPLDWRK
jgi:hypothetical protein